MNLFFVFLGIAAWQDLRTRRISLDVLVGGENPPNPSELLGGERMKELLTTLRIRYDCIIIDLPPVGIVTDALLLSHEVTAYLLVVRPASAI